MLAIEETTTNMTKQSGIDDGYFAKNDELRKAEDSARRGEIRAQLRAKRKLRKKRKIASILSWINTFVSGTTAYIFVIKWLDKAVAVDDTRFFGWCIVAYIPIVFIFSLVGEYIELRIWDKKYE